MSDSERLIMKIAEYQHTCGSKDPDELRACLEQHHEWSPEGARIVIDLALDYGSFILSNALAVALVLGKEDGNRGF